MTHILDDLTRWLAWHLPPSIVYWCAMRVAAGSEEVPKITIMDAINRWSLRHSGKPKRHWGWT